MTSGCKEPEGVEKVYRIKLTNNTAHVLNYLNSYNYPDTLIPDLYNNLRGIREMDFAYFDSKKEWSNVFSENGASKISFFFFSPDTINAYGWNDVRNNYRVLARKDFTIQELENSSYNINYP